MAEIEQKTKGEVKALGEQLKEMPVDMRLFSLTLRSLYVENSVGTNEEAAVKFRKLRDDTRNDAMVYLNGVLPLSTKFVSSISEYFEYYIALEYDEWCDMISDILEETTGYKQLCTTLLKMHEDILVPLKKRKDQAMLLVSEFKDLKEEYERQKQELEAAASTKRGWAWALCWIPGVNAIASPLLAAGADSDLAEAVAKGKQAQIQEAASITVGSCSSRIIMNTQIMSVQRNAVVDLRQQIKGMTKNIQSFSSSMNSLYDDESLGTFSEAGIKLRNLRDDTRDAALVCLKDILPISTSFVSSVSDYFEYYDTMGYEQWCKLIPCILQKTIGYRQLSEKIRQVYEYSLIPLKQRQDQASIVQAEMSELKERYEKKKRELKDTADTKQGWAIGLAFVPIVNIFATPALAVAAGEDYALANKNAARAANMEAAAIEVGQTLIPALHALVSGIAKAAGFFSVMEQEMIKFQGKAEKGIESQKRLHYKVMKQEAQEMKYLCRAFNAALPQVKNDLAALKGNPDPLEKWMKFYFGRKGVK